MMQKNYTGVIFTALITLTLAFPVWAACSATCAVTETTKLNFATLEKPAAGSVNYTIAPNTGSGSGTATVLYGTVARGVYTLTRTGATTGCASVTVSVANVSTGDAGITLSSWTGYFNSGGSILSLPWNRAGVYPALSPGTPFNLGATVTVTSSANTGAITPSFDLSCTIQ